MQKYQDVVLRADGRPAAGATIAVRNYPANTVATIYSDNGVTPIAGGGVVADDSGEYAFYAANGRYSLIISYPGFAGETRSDILLFDPSDTLYFPGNVGIGTQNTGTAGLSLSQNLNLSWEQSATESVANLFRQSSSAALVMSVGYKRSVTPNGFASSFGSSLAKTAISLGTIAGAITFYTNAAAAAAVGTDVTPTERMRIDASGNVGMGRAPNYKLDVYVPGTGSPAIASSNDSMVTVLQSVGSTQANVGTLTSHPLVFIAANTERMRIDASGNIVAGASAALATNATNGFLYVPTCAGTPTGVPTAITGMAPIVVNTTNNKMYFYSGGAWRDAGP